MKPHRPSCRLALTGLVSLLLLGCAHTGHRPGAGPTLILASGQPVAVKPGGAVIPMATLEYWKKLLDSGKVTGVVVRCSQEAVCTTVVTPTGEGGGTGELSRVGLVLQICPAGEKWGRDPTTGAERCVPVFAESQ